MAKLKIEYVAPGELSEYKGNAKVHTDEQIDQIARSIQEFGFNDPIAVWGVKNEIVEGHGRLSAAQRLGLDKVPIIRLDALTDEERRAYTLAHNQLTLNTGFDAETLEIELDNIFDFDMSAYGFELSDTNGDWFETRERYDNDMEDADDEYKAFVDKFKPKLTTDDCYTPDIVYDAVADWVAAEYGLDRFTSSLGQTIHGARAVVAPCPITYENGATVLTSFLTNLEPEDLIARGAPTLYDVVLAANAENLKDKKKEIPKYEYPDNVITAAMIGKYAKNGVSFSLHKEDGYFIRELDAQKEAGKAVYGCGYLISHRSAEEKRAAEKVQKQREREERYMQWELSPREQAIVDSLGGDHGEAAEG